ncbi:MAG: transposase [Planctomycetota bacterium]
MVHRDLTGIESIGIDEIQYRRGHNYLTLVYQLDQGFKRLLYVRKDRSEEARQMHRDGYESVLKNSRWSILKRRSNLTTNQTVKLRELLKYNLRTVKAYLMREDFHRFCLCNLNTLRPER